MRDNNSFFVIINEQDQVIHSSQDPDNLPLMMRYVRKAKEAGDDWSLLEYRLSRVIEVDRKSTDIVGR